MAAAWPDRSGIDAKMTVKQYSLVTVRAPRRAGEIGACRDA
jgi:hypothetical protein